MSPNITKYLLWGVGGLVTLAAIALVFIPDIEVVIPEEKVRAAIEDRIPLRTEADEFAFEVRDAEVEFYDNNNKGGISIRTEVRLSGLGLAGKGTANTSTSVRYEKGAFYLSDLRLDDLEIEPTLASRAKIAALKKAFQAFLDDVEADIALDDPDAADAFAEFRKLFVPVVRTALDENLGKIPVYRLRGSAAKNAARLVLKDVTFRDREAVAILSPTEAILKIAGGLIAGLIAILLGIEWMRHQHAITQKPKDEPPA